MARILPFLVLAMAACCAAIAPARTEDGYRWRIPAWLPPPLVPSDNVMSDAKVELGRRLFFDRRLSADESQSCASCHEPARAFSDGRTTPSGIRGDRHPRNAPSLANVGYLPVLTWANPLISRLEHQALIPLFGETPVEMGMAGRESELRARLAAHPTYREMFAAAFPEANGIIDLGTITKALAAFQRTLISADSPYDRYRYGGDGGAISASARRGEALFFSERLECFHCHGGVNLTDSLVHSRKPLAEFGFHNTGLYDRDGKGAYPSDNVGLMEQTGQSGDMGKFRTPSLRNVALTAPYMHDGSIADLAGVIDHYAAGGRARSALTSPFLPGFVLSEQEKGDLIAFLKSLTDESFVTNPRFADPAGEAGSAAGRSGG